MLSRPASACYYNSICRLKKKYLRKYQLESYVRQSKENGEQKPKHPNKKNTPTPNLSETFITET